MEQKGQNDRRNYDVIVTWGQDWNRTSNTRDYSLLKSKLRKLYDELRSFRKLIPH